MKECRRGFVPVRKTCVNAYIYENLHQLIYIPIENNIFPLKLNN